MAPMANKSRSAHFSQILCCPRSRILKYVRSDSVQFLPASNNSVVIPGLPFEILVPGVMDEFCRFCLEMPQDFPQGPFGILHQGPILFCGRSRETQTYGNVGSILKSRVMRLLGRDLINQIPTHAFIPKDNYSMQVIWHDLIHIERDIRHFIRNRTPADVRYDPYLRKLDGTILNLPKAAFPPKCVDCDKIGPRRRVVVFFQSY